MPTYDYLCPGCGHVEERRHSMNERPRVKCPKCRKEMRKQFGSGACVIFKGDGFHCNDYPKVPMGDAK